MPRNAASVICGGLLLLTACQAPLTPTPASTAALQPGVPATVAAVTPATATDVALRQRSSGCHVPRFQFRSGGVVAMTTKNDGNWCWIALQTGYGGPFNVVIPVVAPAHGAFETAPVGDSSRLSYKPNSGFSGEDSFKVDLQPGANSMTVNVSVE